MGKPTAVSSPEQQGPSNQQTNQQNQAAIATSSNVPSDQSSSIGPKASEESLISEQNRNSNSNKTHEEKENNLKEENERLKNERLCVICLTKDKNVLFLPCAHLAACLECSLSLKTCPICRSKIQASVRTFT